MPLLSCWTNLVAFDTGPGNMMLDALASRISGGRTRMDRDGRVAARGHVNSPLLERLMRHPYFRRRPPKSTGREEFGEHFLDRVVADALDALADLRLHPSFLRTSLIALPTSITHIVQMDTH